VNVPLFWNQPRAVLIEALGSGPAGLSPDEASRRLSVYGRNDAAAPKRRSGWQRFLVLFANPLVVILLFASALSAITGDTASFIIIVTIVVLSVVMDFVQEMRAQNAIDALQAKVALRARVVRGGQEVTVLVTELVPGDVVNLCSGDLVPGTVAC
jgi:Mg2+-importing ATPase